MFLLPSINMKLRPKILDLEARHAHRLEHVHDGRLASRRDADGHRRLLELVHGAAVDRAGEGRGHVERRRRATLTLTQQFQMISGTLAGAPLENAKLHGDEITFSAGGTTYTGKVNGTTMRAADGSWTATKK